MASTIRSGTLENGHTRSGWRDSAVLLCVTLCSHGRVLKGDTTTLRTRKLQISH